MSEQAPDYGGGGFADADRLAGIAKRLQSYTDRLSGHATLEIRAWDDGSLEAELIHTLGFTAGVGEVGAGAAKEAIVYNTETGQIEYHEYIARNGRRDMQAREVLEGESP